MAHLALGQVFVFEHFLDRLQIETSVVIQNSVVFVVEPNLLIGGGVATLNSVVPDLHVRHNMATGIHG